MGKRGLLLVLALALLIPASAFAVATISGTVENETGSRSQAPM
ncbi:MAG: hypothetical protein MAG453_02092 [Calditrichaeota bacterium]|nr:hypothetical protein [Calditrichota bacterium]